jgi:hypothetical protein
MTLTAPLIVIVDNLVYAVKEDKESEDAAVEEIFNVVKLRNPPVAAVVGSVNPLMVDVVVPPPATVTVKLLNSPFVSTKVTLPGVLFKFKFNAAVDDGVVKLLVKVTVEPANVALLTVKFAKALPTMVTEPVVLPAEVLFDKPPTVTDVIVPAAVALVALTSLIVTGAPHIPPVVEATVGNCCVLAPVAVVPVMLTGAKLPLATAVSVFVPLVEAEPTV